MTEFIDRNDFKRRIEFSPSYKEDYVKITIETPQKSTHAMTWEMPLKAAMDLQKELEVVLNGI